MMTDIMMDLETMGNTSTAAIIQIGAVRFDPDSGEIGAEFRHNIDLQSCLDHGLTVDASTIYWWMARSDAARNSVGHIGDNSRQQIADVLLEFRKFITTSGTEPRRVWSHATFDFVILQNAYQMTRIGMPFGYNIARDIRTLLDLAEYDPFSRIPREGVHHDALDDARYQARYTVEALREIAHKKHLGTMLNQLKNAQQQEVGCE